MTQGYSIIGTLNGPLVSFEDKYITLMEHHHLIDVAEANPGFIEDMRLHILEQIRNGADEVMEALRSNLHPQPAKMYAYTNAASQYMGFVQGTWNSYVNAKKEQ